MAASTPFSLMNFAASLHKVTHSSFIPLSAIALEARTTLTNITNAITATFLIASPFLLPVHTVWSHHLSPRMHRIPVVPHDRLLRSVHIDGIRTPDPPTPPGSIPGSPNTI